MTSDPTDPSDKVVSFPGAEPLPENPITVTGAPTFCDHEAITLDEHQRQVHCTRCNAVLDAFDFLRHNARTLQRAWQNYRIVQSKASELQDRVEVLAKEHRRLAAQVKRLQEKTAPLQVRGKDLL